jgi:hypothetical protein
LVVQVKKERRRPEKGKIRKRETRVASIITI